MFIKVKVQKKKLIMNIKNKLIKKIWNYNNYKNLIRKNNKINLLKLINTLKFQK